MQEDNASLYQSIIEKYNSSSRKISLYQLDLSNSRNNICLSDNYEKMVKKLQHLCASIAKAC